MSMGSMLRSVLFPPCHHLRTGGARRLPNERRLAGAAANARWRRVTVATDVERRNHLKAFIARSPSTLLAPSEISVLLCGEGDFSFTRALASGVPSNNHQNHMSITATSYEPVDEIKAAWGGAANLQDLEKFGFVDVIHGVDATALDTMFPNRKWDKICFMFPHIAGKGKISLNRKLLAGFFRAANKVLSPGGTVEVTLVAGQGGTAADGQAQRAFGNTWQVVTQAAEGNMVLCETASFDAASWESLGYRSRGHWRGLTQERGFAVSDGVIHLFRREGELGRAICPAPVGYPRDVSFWLDDPSTFCEGALLRVVRDTAGVGVDTELLFLEEWRRDEKISRTYRVTYSSVVLAFSRQHANTCQFALRDAIDGGFLSGASLR